MQFPPFWQGVVPHSFISKNNVFQLFFSYILFFFFVSQPFCLFCLISFSFYYSLPFLQHCPPQVLLCPSFNYSLPFLQHCPRQVLLCPSTTPYLFFNIVPDKFFCVLLLLPTFPSTLSPTSPSVSFYDCLPFLQYCSRQVLLCPLLVPTFPSTLFTTVPLSSYTTLFLPFNIVPTTPSVSFYYSLSTLQHCYPQILQCPSTNPYLLFNIVPNKSFCVFLLLPSSPSTLSPTVLLCPSTTPFLLSTLFPTSPSVFFS